MLPPHKRGRLWTLLVVLRRSTTLVTKLTSVPALRRRLALKTYR